MALLGVDATVLQVACETMHNFDTEQYPQKGIAETDVAKLPLLSRFVIDGCLYYILHLRLNNFHLFPNPPLAEHENVVNQAYMTLAAYALREPL